MPTTAATSEASDAEFIIDGPAGVEAVAVADRLGTDLEAGLSEAEAARRLELVGPNELPSPPGLPAWRRFLGHFADPVVYLLIAAIVIALVAWLAEGADGLPYDAVVIALIVVANAVIGYVQEERAGRAVAALQDMTRTEASVLRAGHHQAIPAAGLVPGDLLVLGDGDVVPADARLVEVASLRVAEATLTGESLPVTKATSVVEPAAPLGDRVGMVFSGTEVVSGRGRAVVTATGAGTEVGRIATLLGETESEDTPLQREIDVVGKTLGVVVVAIAVIVVATLVIVADLRTTSELVEGLLIGVSLAVAAVPEGLPAVLSVVLALGVQRMSGRNALVKRLASVETLGSSTVICSDKTGTLTRNEMMVRRIVVPSARLTLTGTGYEPAGTIEPITGEPDDLVAEPPEPVEPSEPVPGENSPVDPAVEPPLEEVVLDEAQWALLAGRLASNGSVEQVEGRFVPVGDPTEAAIGAAGPKAGLNDGDVNRRFNRHGENPFTSERKLMSTVLVDVDDPDAPILAVKGAPDVLIERCRAERRAGRIVALSDERRRWWLDAVESMAGEAFRTLGVAYRPVDQDHLNGELDETIENELVLLGVLGIIDPPRTEVAEAVAVAHRAGIRVVMITGDHPLTAARIASELGITEAGAPFLSGPELEGMSDDELSAAVSEVSVYARVSPEHKLRIVRALSGRGEVVAMTGDGVNDAPALKAADIGIAMGITGTDVSKEASDMILTDDNFATIVAAVTEGRAIFHNIRSFLRYLLSSNIGEVLTVFIGVVAAGAIGLRADGNGIAAPLLAVQILWINLITDSGPALALGVDPPIAGLMDRRPRRLSERVIDRRMQTGIGIIGLTMALATLLMLDLGLPGGLVGGDGDGDLVTARTGAFTVLVLAQLFNTFNARSDTETVVGRLGINRWLLVAVVVSALFQVAVVHLGFLNQAFGTAPLSLAEWLLAAVLASSVLWVSEIRKYVLRRRTAVDELD